MATFYNPYLARRAKQSKMTHAPIDCTRLVPSCFKEPGRTGLVSVRCDAPYTYFLHNSEHMVYPSGKLSMWRDALPPCSVHPIVGNLSFHAFNIVETVYSKDRCDDVPFSLQTDIIPCGIVIKLIGRTSDNRSICVNVFGQQVYFYASAAPGVNIEYIVQQALTGHGFHRQSQCSFNIITEKKRLLKTYDTAEHVVYRISLSSPALVSTISAKLQEAGCEVFETNVDATRRFIIDNGFSTFGWYTCLSAIPRQKSSRDSWTELEFDCCIADLIFHPDKKEWPEYTVMSFDIECIGEKGFPNATRDEDMIIQISCVLWKTGREKGQYRNILLSLGTCSHIPNTEVYQFPAELDMLHAFFTMLRDMDIDIITGYNIANFDLPYILDRATCVYSITPSLFCRVRSGSQFEVHKPKGGAAGFMRAQTKIKIAGILAIDMYIVCKDKLSLSDYKLNTVAMQCLGGQKKEDVSYKEIPILFRRGPDGRAKVGIYCIQDSVLVMELLLYFMAHVEISEIAKIAMIPVNWVLANGQQVRVFSCLLAAARRENYILPISKQSDSGGYQGATVINPISGFYNDAVLVVDFASLYPSIMQAHNLCYSTLIPHNELHRHTHLKPADYETFEISTGKVHFVKKHVTHSLLSKLLTAWLAKRKEIRRELESCHDPQLKTILDKQQLAIKVTCNAVYGFTGVATGLLPCLKIAETVTLQGRRMLEASKRFIENVDKHSLCQIVGGEVEGADDASFRVIYGDTDSLFIQCKGYSIDSVTAFGEKLASVTSRTLFPEPIRLEAEKTFKCLMLLTKKRYIGILSTGKILMKGVDLVRKTACSFVQERCKEILSLVLLDDGVREAAQALSARGAAAAYAEGLPTGFLKVIDILNKSYSELHSGLVPINSLIFSTELSRDLGSYKNASLPHLVVYRKILERNEEPPQVHDRIPYVFIKAPSCTKKSDMAEDPKYVQRHNIPIAADQYFDKLIHGAANILQCLFDNNSDTAAEVLYNFIRCNINLFD